MGDFGTYIDIKILLKFEMQWGKRDIKGKWEAQVRKVDEINEAIDAWQQDCTVTVIQCNRLQAMLRKLLWNYYLHISEVG